MKAKIVLANPAHPGEQRELKVTQATARYYHVKAAADFNAAFDAVMNDNANAIAVFPDALAFGRRTQIAEFAIKRRFPASLHGRSMSRLGVSCPMGRTARRP